MCFTELWLRVWKFYMQPHKYLSVLKFCFIMLFALYINEIKQAFINTTDFLVIWLVTTSPRKLGWIFNSYLKKIVFCIGLKLEPKLSNGHSPQIRRNGKLLVRMCRMWVTVWRMPANVSSVECIESRESSWRMSVECSESGLSRVANLANLANF